jgi:hypothetical protein
VAAAPVFQQGLDQSMADLACLLWAVLSMYAARRLLLKADVIGWTLIVLSLAAAALTKGTAVCLAPLPLVALACGRHRFTLSASRIALILAGISLAVSPYILLGHVREWGGIGYGETWGWSVVGSLAGWGFVLIALLGLRRTPLALIAGTLVVSALATSYAIGAMREPRHWIMALPALVLLAGLALQRVPHPAARILLLLPAIALFPFSRYQQPRSGFADLARQIPRPARMLVSSSGSGEGSWIAEASLSEQRPSSLIARATKVLVEEGWNGEDYRLLTPTPDAVLHRIDELALNVVILHSVGNAPDPPHQRVLRRAIEDNPSWRRCGAARDLAAFCRVGVPALARVPLRLQVHGWDFEERLPR